MRDNLQNYPQNPFEKLIYDRALKRWQIVGAFAALFGPAPVLWHFWYELVDALTIEVVGGMYSLIQMGLFAAIPYPLGAYMARRELAQARRDGEIPDWKPPPAPIRERRLVQYFPLQPGLAASLDRDARRFVVKRDGEPDKLADDALFGKLEATRLYLIGRCGFSSEQLDFLLYRANLGFALTVEGREPASTLVQTHTAPILAQKIIEEAERTNYRDWRRAQNF